MSAPSNSTDSMAASVVVGEVDVGADQRPGLSGSAAPAARPHPHQHLASESSQKAWTSGSSLTDFTMGR